MAEYLHNKPHFDLLADFVRSLVNGESGKILVDRYWEAIEQVSPEEVMRLFDLLISEGVPVEKVKAYSGKIVNVFYKGLSSREWELPLEGHFLHYMMLENRGVEQVLDRIRAFLKEQPEGEIQRKEWALRLRAVVEELLPYEKHYIKKENILFPYIEQTFPAYRCLQVMWSFHDDFRRLTASLLGQLSGDPDPVQLNREMGELFFVILPVIFREENIIFPVALRALPPDTWPEMLAQASETGWCYITGPVTDPAGRTVSETGSQTDLVTGSLLPEQLRLMLDHLPLDITFVDENDEVRYFTGGSERIFPRSKAIIGRKVQNCHPPESVQVVNRIVEAFKSGERDVADFRIRLHERFIHIRYFALRDQSGHYRGTIEVSQDVTDIRSMEGERRLLDWDTEGDQGVT